MKIILFSTEDSMSDVSRLESTSASDFHAFHIRKPNWSKEKLEEYITHLPLEWLSISVLHSHFDLLNDFNIKGIHLNEKNRSEGIDAKYHSNILSTSFHTIEDLVADESNYEYVFLSPIFDSISKQGYKSAFNFEYLKQVNTESSHDIIALGGVDSNKFKECKSLGFKGVAILGSFWNT